MSTSTSRAEQKTVLRPSGASKWLTAPSFDERMERRIERTLQDIRGKLTKGCILVHRTLRISNPPRKVELEMSRVTVLDHAVVLDPIKLAHGQRKDWENVCPDLIVVASELAMRWPEAARPEDIALVTDGVSLWFNPGRPDGVDHTWLTDHLEGTSPCAMIHRGGRAMPFEPVQTKPTGEVH